jgi:hypothetical protein
LKHGASDLSQNLRPSAEMPPEEFLQEQTEKTEDLSRQSVATTELRADPLTG